MNTTNDCDDILWQSSQNYLMLRLYLPVACCDPEWKLNFVFSEISFSVALCMCCMDQKWIGEKLNFTSTAWPWSIQSSIKLFILLIISYILIHSQKPVMRKRIAIRFHSRVSWHKTLHQKRNVCYRYWALALCMFTLPQKKKNSTKYATNLYSHYKACTL